MSAYTYIYKCRIFLEKKEIVDNYLLLVKRAIRIGVQEQKGNSNFPSDIYRLTF